MGSIYNFSTLLINLRIHHRGVDKLMIVFFHIHAHVENDPSSLIEFLRLLLIISMILASTLFKREEIDSYSFEKILVPFLPNFP